MRHFRLPFPLPCLVLAATLQAGCDATIHEYPTAQTSQVIVELNADRMPPDYYKELVYDKDGNHTEKLLEQVPSAEYRISEDFDMRFIVELYRVPTPTDDVDKGTLEARREISVHRLMHPPQDTLHFYVPDGLYKVLAWADYVPCNEQNDWHFHTDALDEVRVNLNHVPENNHQKNSGAGFTDFSVDFTRDEEGLPQAANQTRAAKDNRLIPVYLKRPAGRFRLWATDYQEFLQNGHRAEDLTVRIIYKQYVSAGYDVSMQEPNAFIETRVMETTPGRVAADGTMLLAYDYVLTSDTQEDHVLVDIAIYDRENGTELNHFQNVDIPLRRNRETVVRGPFLTREVGSGIEIDDNFDGEFVVPIN